MQTTKQLSRSIALMVAIAASLAGATAQAQQTAPYPNKAITIIVPFAAGGNTDVKTRLVAQQLSSILGQPVVIDNRPGASGNIGMEMVARAAPDGYTIGMGSFGPLAVNPWIYPKINFAPESLVPIILLEKSPLVLTTPASKPFKSVAEIIAAAKKAPGSLNIANAGPGGAHHLSAELFESAAGIDMVGIPFKGGGPAATALLAGQVDLMFEQTGAALQAIKAGKIRPIAVTSPLLQIRALVDPTTPITRAPERSPLEVSSSTGALRSPWAAAWANCGLGGITCRPTGTPRVPIHSLPMASARTATWWVWERCLPSRGCARPTR